MKISRAMLYADHTCACNTWEDEAPLSFTAPPALLMLLPPSLRLLSPAVDNAVGEAEGECSDDTVTSAVLYILLSKIVSVSVMSGLPAAGAHTVAAELSEKNTTTKP